MLPYTSMFALTLALALGATTATARDAAKAPTPQQRMADCNQQASDMTGAQRKSFMSACLKGEAVAMPAKQTQQEKMTACNAQAGSRNLKGADRRIFVSTCLRSDDTVSTPAH
ncbi:MAG: hypothetical protein F9K31_06370 [Dokdonella sp.]|nr:MAG: hypothetical protein F9K31_06370 [Dokdonella sp.]